MKKAELLRLLNDLDDNAEITVTDTNQDNAWNIVEVRVCEDNASEYKSTYADIVIE